MQTKRSNWVSSIVKRSWTMRIQPLGITKRSTKAAFLALALLASLAMSAEAKWTRTHASACYTAGSAGTPSGAGNWSIYNASATQDMIVSCPVSDTDYFLKQNITILNVHGFNANTITPTLAQACSATWYTFGGSCGSVATASAYGQYTLQPGLAAWGSANAADFGFLWMRIPRQQSTASSSLRGYYTSD